MVKLKMSKHQAFEECMGEFPDVDDGRVFYPWKIEKGRDRVGVGNQEMEKPGEVIDVKVERVSDDVQEKKSEGDVFKAVGEQVGRVLGEGGARKSRLSVLEAPMKTNMPGGVPVY